MKSKLSNLLSEKAADMGLSKKAIEQFVEIAAEGLSDDASDEDIANAVESLLPFAKITQGEVTRKTKPKPSTPKPSVNEGSEGDKNKGDEMPEWAKGFKAQLDTLVAENNALKAEKAKSERSALIAAKAKELGIPDYLMKRVAFDEKADIDKELSDYKQELVNNNLMPKGQASETATTLEQMKADAQAWVKQFPKAQ